MINNTYLSFFKTLCNETRLSIVLLLKKKSMDVTQLVNGLNLEQSRISHNLKCLEKNGFVNVEKKGKHRVYSLNKDTIEPIFKNIKKHTQKYNIKVCVEEK
jgi:DNA-binding transcriptional ArsR family regulator